MWSFVKNKKNKQWIWIAINKENREIIGLYIGTRSAKGAKGLWESIPKIYREQPGSPLVRMKRYLVKTNMILLKNKSIK